MTSELSQFQEAHPIINPGKISSKAAGYENIAKTLGNIAERSISKAEDFASEASKANLLQTHGMLQDIEAQSKIEMFRNPAHAQSIAKNAQGAVDKIKGSARLNKGDRQNLEYMAGNTTRGLNLSAAEKEISLTRERAKFNALSTLGDTLQSFRNDVFTNPEQADKLVQAQYESIKGLVSSGTITAVEAANIHKQFAGQLELAHKLTEGMKEGILDASDVSMWHETAPGNIPLSNEKLPMAHDTAMNIEHHFGRNTPDDIENKFANGIHVSSAELAGLKGSDVDKVFNYGLGAKRATADFKSGKSWVELSEKLNYLKKQEKLSLFEKGYKQRLNNFMNTMSQPGAYQDFIASTPEGARAQIQHAQTQDVINSDVPYGTPEEVSKQKYLRTQDNWNELISKNASIGVGMHMPDYLKQPIPLQLITPIQHSFDKGGDVISAIKNIQYLSPRNRVYAMNAFQDNPRKALTVYEIGNLADNAEAGFLVNLLESQQVDALNREGKPKESQQKYLNLNQGKEGYSDQKIRGLLNPALTSINNYLSKQPNGGSIISAKMDQALRYVKFIASEHNDSNFEHINSYIADFARNMNKAYGITTGFNFIVDKQSVPLEDNQTSVLASYAINDVRKKLLEFRSPEEVDNIFSQRPPILVSSPGGRITVINPDGQAVADKHGHPAFNELYSESLWQHAENDKDAVLNGTRTINPLFGQPTEVKAANALNYLRGKTDILRPEVEGNINLENRPKVWKNGRYETIKTFVKNIDGKTVLLPTIINGKEVSTSEATKHYKKTGEHLGIFKNKEEAEKYNKQLYTRLGLINETEKGTK